jgi:hypothetical protein
MEKKKGKVKSIRKDNTAACITIDTEAGPEDVWFSLAPQIKPNYIKVGSECDISFEPATADQNPILTYINCGKAFTPSSNYVFKPKPASDFVDRQDIISKQWAINTAVEILKIKNEEILSESVKTVAEMLLKLRDQI